MLYVQYVPLNQVVEHILIEFDHIFVDQKGGLQDGEIKLKGKKTEQKNRRGKMAIDKKKENDKQSFAFTY